MKSCIQMSPVFDQTLQLISLLCSEKNQLCFISCVANHIKSIKGCAHCQTLIFALFDANFMIFQLIWIKGLQGKRVIMDGHTEL